MSDEETKPRSPRLRGNKDATIRRDYSRPPSPEVDAEPSTYSAGGRPVPPEDAPRDQGPVNKAVDITEPTPVVGTDDARQFSETQSEGQSTPSAAPKSDEGGGSKE